MLNRTGKCYSRCHVVAAGILVATSVYIITQGLQCLSTNPTINISKNVDEHSRGLFLPTPLPVTEEVRHIGFVKVHKAASSTMQNMFYRFGLKRNLTFVFTKHPNYFSRTSTNHIPLVKPKYRTSYDILCNHGVFNIDIYSSLLPKDTVYIGIVRDPLAVFVSAVNYYLQPSQLLDYLSRIRGNKLQNLIRYPEVYDRQFFSYTKNVMARDFGFPATTHSKQISTYLDKIDSIFKLVIIVEHFEESLVLMKRYFNWSLKDILFLSNNVYGKGGSVDDLTPKDLELFKKRNSLDYLIYDFFYKKFWKQINSESNDIHDEILCFKSMLTSLQTFCSTGNGTNNSRVEFIQTKWNEKFEVYHSECDLMKKDELDFITMLRIKQGSELRKL